jgi:hypothetical protein
MLLLRLFCIRRRGVCFMEGKDFALASSLFFLQIGFW